LRYITTKEELYSSTQGV